MADTRLATRQTEQWGWEYRGQEVVVIEHQEPPVPAVPAPTGLAKLESRRATVTRLRPVLVWAVAGAAVLTVVVGVVVQPLVALASAALTLGLAWLRWGWPEQLRRASAVEHQRWLEECIDTMDEFEHDVQTWQLELSERERTKASQVAATRPWVPVGPATKERVDLYGGTAAGWRAAVMAMGSSLMSAGGRLTVLDLTQDAVVEPLHRMAEEYGAPIQATVVPSTDTSSNLLAGLNADEIGVVIAEGLRGAEPEQSESRGVDATLVQQVVECLTDSPVTFSRLHLAFQVLQRQLTPDQRGELSRGEFARLTDLLSESARRSAEPRLFRLAAGVKRLASVSGDLAMDGPDISIRHQSRMTRPPARVKNSRHPQRTTSPHNRRKRMTLTIARLASTPPPTLRSMPVQNANDVRKRKAASPLRHQPTPTRPKSPRTPVRSLPSTLKSGVQWSETALRNGLLRGWRCHVPRSPKVLNRRTSRSTSGAKWTTDEQRTSAMGSPTSRPTRTRARGWLRSQTVSR
ncbi:hypothetical protein [Kribbella sp. NPDC004875]|uniref:hypothetical protein n=1 Tax=Kribbella sp. NPDC004875 TaxID=3364107 RepID=UPI00367F898E